jgi:hypothetical protein
MLRQLNKHMNNLGAHFAEAVAHNTALLNSDLYRARMSFQCSGVLTPGRSRA